MSDGTNQTVVASDKVSFSYNGEPVLQDITFAIEPLDYVSVVGPNGGGKTTLLRLILGLLKPNHGTIRVFGRPPDQVRPMLGYVPQHFLFDPKFPVRVIDVVLMGRLSGLSRLGRYRRSDREGALSALREVEMDGFHQRHISELSGGQRQRVLIARALACEPRLLLLDEPTAHVDTAAQKEVMRILQQLNNRMTVIMSTHDVAYVSSFVKSVLCVNRTAAMHPMDKLTGDMIVDVYGSDIRYVRHDQINRPPADGSLNCD